MSRLTEYTPDPDCPRCKGSSVDPEDSEEGIINFGSADPPVLVPCILCQYEPEIIRVRRKPVVIRTMWWTGRREHLAQARDFLGESFGGIEGHKQGLAILVTTLHGKVPAEPGCWLAEGELDCWPVNRHHHATTYERVED